MASQRLVPAMESGDHSHPVRPIDAFVLKPIAGVGSWQAAQNQNPVHECEIEGRFAGRTQSVHLIEAGEEVSGLGRQRILHAWLFPLLDLHPRSGPHGTPKIGGPDFR